MKKLTSIILIVLMLSVLVVPAMASEKSGMEIDEARTLIWQSFYFWNHTRGPWMYDNMLSSDSLKENPFYFLIDEAKLPGGSFEAMKECAKDIYTDDLAPLTYAKCCTFPNEDLFFEKDGKLYAHDDFPQGTHKFGYFYARDSKIYENAIPQGMIDKSQFIFTENSNDQAKGLFFASTCGDGHEHYVSLEIEFKNTENGWRISGGEFVTTYFMDAYAVDGTEYACAYYTHDDEQGRHVFEVDYRKCQEGVDVEFAALPKGASEMDFGDGEHTIYITVSPSTGDSALTRIAFFGAMALAALVPPALLIRKKRREF